MQQEINKCMEEFKLIFNNHNISGFNKMNIFKDVYSNLKNDYGIDLYKRKNKSKTSLYNLFSTKEELQIFKNLMVNRLESKGYKLENINDNENYYKSKDELIDYIKKEVKTLNKNEQVDFLRELYSEMTIKGISLYARRGNEKKALINFIEEEEIELVEDMYKKVAYKYKLN